MRPYVEDASLPEGARDLGSVHAAQAPRDAARAGALARGERLGRNLLTLSSYSGLDPEVSNFGQPADRTQLRRRAVSTEPELLALGVGGAVKEASTMRLKLPGIAVAAATLSLIPATACSLDVPAISITRHRRARAEPDARHGRRGLRGPHRRQPAQHRPGQRLHRAARHPGARGLQLRWRADPRFFGDALLEGPLQPGSPFGGNFGAARTPTSGCEHHRARGGQGAGLLARRGQRGHRLRQDDRGD